jgi:hypothetical protein
MTGPGIRRTIAGLSIAASVLLAMPPASAETPLQRNDRKGGEADVAAAKKLDPDVVKDFAAVAAK